MTNTKFDKSLKIIAGYILKFLMCILVLGMILASIDLAYEFYMAIISPPVGLINTQKLYKFFSLILIIATVLIFSFGPIVSICVFYSFNKMFREQFKKKILTTKNVTSN